MEGGRKEAGRDVVVAKELREGAEFEIVRTEDCPEDAMMLDAGPDSEGVDPDAVLAEVTGAPIHYPLSGNAENHPNIISQNLSRVKGEGWVEQVPQEGRKRGLPYRLTTDGMTWVQQNAGTLIQPSRRTDEWVENPGAETESDEG